MAESAVRGESRCAVIRIPRRIVIFEVATDTAPWCSRVDPARVAVRAVEGGVLALQTVVMIEDCLVPRDVVWTVTNVALSREAGCRVVRVPSTFVVLTMAGIAVWSHGAFNSVIGVTAAAIDRQMLRPDLETRVHFVVPYGRDPTDRFMAVFTLHSEEGPERVILAADPMAVVAACRRPLRDPVPVARGAGNFQVTAFERQQTRLVERPRSVLEMGVRSVTCSAVRAQGCLVGIDVAGGAIGCQGQKGSGGVTVRTFTGKLAVESL